MATPQDVDDLESLRIRVINLAHATLGELEKDLRTGSVAQRNTAIRTIAPYLLRTLASSDEADQQADLKAAVTDLMAEMRDK